MGDFQISTGHRAVGEVYGNWAQGDFVHVAPISEKENHINLTKTVIFILQIYQTFSLGSVCRNSCGCCSFGSVINSSFIFSLGSFCKRICCWVGSFINSSFVTCCVGSDKADPRSFEVSLTKSKSMDGRMLSRLSLWPPSNVESCSDNCSSKFWNAVSSLIQLACWAGKSVIHHWELNTAQLPLCNVRLYLFGRARVQDILPHFFKKVE